MPKVHHTGGVSFEDEIGLTTRIQQEMKSMVFNKERYDLDHPDHTRNLIPRQLRQIAREKVIQEMCIPLCSANDSIEV